MEIAAAFQRRGLLYVLSSPSGAGKSTIARMLLASDDGIAMSVSATTRPIRPGDILGDREALELLRSYYAIPENQRRRLFVAAPQPVTPRQQPVSTSPA